MTKIKGSRGKGKDGKGKNTITATVIDSYVITLQNPARTLIVALLEETEQAKLFWKIHTAVDELGPDHDQNLTISDEGLQLVAVLRKAVLAGKSPRGPIKRLGIGAKVFESNPIKVWEAAIRKAVVKVTAKWEAYTYGQEAKAGSQEDEGSSGSQKDPGAKD